MPVNHQCDHQSQEMIQQELQLLHSKMSDADINFVILTHACLSIRVGIHLPIGLDECQRGGGGGGGKLSDSTSYVFVLTVLRTGSSAPSTGLRAAAAAVLLQTVQHPEGVSAFPG